MAIWTRTFLTTLFLAGTSGAVLPVQAEDESFLGGEFSANVSMLNDYRFRGISLNDEGFALQGGFDWFHDSGIYVGTWATNISDFNGSTVETDIYGGYAGEVDGISYDIGVMLYHYPGGTNTDYVELYGSTGIDLGFISAFVGANYAFSNDNLGNEDNIYIFTDGSVIVPNTPVTLNLHLGFEDGAFGDKKWDWIIGASVSYADLDFGISYIDTNVAGDNADARIVFSIGASF
ncbi:MAG: hypothetical protein COB49_05060 [Alphaproteobacteria bacterium]|nr:MAG: hypothetical protein COB49_05060 [Alphaproteobacteria bacterium]